MGGIATPLGSDMSMRKFDFSGYDPKAMRKKKAPSPERKVIKKTEEDMEVFISDMTEQPDQGDLDRKNEQSAQVAREGVLKGIYEIKQNGDLGDNNLLNAQIEVMNLQNQINEETIEPQQAYTIFNEFESLAVQREQNLLDLQVGGEATREQQLYERIHHPDESYILPQLKLERLAVELTQLEAELVELEKSDIPGGYSDENDSKSHLKEIDHLRAEMEKILGSEAFESLEGRSKIHDLLNEGSQISVHNALNELIQRKITEYSSSTDPSKQEGGTFNIGSAI